MASEFDPYREALVMERTTIWPQQYLAWEPAERAQVEARLHAEPQAAAQLRYIRQHTGFQREITVTDADIERLRSAQA